MSEGRAARFAYADSPYLGCCGHYGHEHGPDGLCWDDPATHRKLVERTDAEYDGWALSLSVKSLPTILTFCPDDVLVLAWFKPIAPPLGDHRRYNWEPVIVKPLRRYGEGYVPIAVVASPPMFTFRETPAEHVIGQKPEAFVHWVLANGGVTREDEFTDLFHGSGAVAQAWETYNPGHTVSDGYAASKASHSGSNTPPTPKDGE